MWNFFCFSSKYGDFFSFFPPKAKKKAFAKKENTLSSVGFGGGWELLFLPERNISMEPMR
jgi:hypothetical protein